LIEAFAEKSEQIYNKRYKEEFEKLYKGKIVAIEPESGDCFIGNAEMEAAMQAKIKYPDKFFHFIRVGYKAVYKRR
jgi:hypothetical protein